MLINYPMKVLFVHNRYRQYAGEDVALELESALLERKGHLVKTLLFDNREIGGLFSRLSISLSAIYSFSAARKISRVIKEFKPDIIHVHNLFFKVSPSVFHTARKYGIPVIHTLHNYRLICCNALLLRDNKICELCIHKKFPLYGIRYKCYRNSGLQSALVTAITGTHKLLGTWKRKVSTFVVSNEFSRSRLLDSSLGISKDRIIAKSNFVADPGEGKLSREDFFLFAGRIAKEKGVHVLLDAFAGLPGRKLVIIGEGPEKASLEAQFKSCNNIHFTGQLDKTQVLENMKRCRAFICPSVWYEVTPFTNLEALATGTPVIASRLGSMIGTLKNGYDGLHFTAGDAADLREKVELFVQQTATSNEYYKNARQSYLEKYHPDVHYKMIIKIYEDAIASGQ